MGRLNYTNRKTDGLKLGQIIAKDLIKRIPPGTGSKSAFRDPDVELDVAGKNLGEEGFREAGDALIKALQYDGEQRRVLYLEELCLKSNKLNASCLPALADIVRLAAYDLRDLDLSENDFTITSRQDADAWQDILESFGQCCMLRRVDFSGNALGPKAFEVLARVYSREPEIDQLPDDDVDIVFHDATPSRTSISGDTEALGRQARKMSLGSAQEMYTDDDEPRSVAGSKAVHGIRHDSKSPEKAGHPNDLDTFRTYFSTRGLRSVPYLVLLNTGITDAGALYLSYILSCHYHPDRLLRHVPPARSAHHIHQLGFYGAETGCQGIIYLPNESISSPGLKLLELCEGARFSLFDDDRPAPLLEGFQAPFRKASAARKTSATHSSPSTIAAGGRRRSGTKDEQDELTDTEAVSAELDRARSRIQGNVIRDEGVQNNDIWRTALQMLTLCRMLCPLRKEEPDPQPPRAPRAPEGTTTPVHPVNNADYPKLSKQNPKPFVGYLDPFTPLPASKNPITPSPRSKNKPLKLKTTTPSPLSITTSPTSPSPGTSGLQSNKPYRGDLPLGFPEEAWVRIVGLLLQADRFMGRTQQSNVLRWAVDRRTLARELESLGKPESAQIWKVLDGMGCLAYEVDG